MCRVLLVLLVLAGCTGCQPLLGPWHVGRPVALDHWFPVAHTYAPHGYNTHSRPPCPYFDPPPCDGDYVFCQQCGVYHVAR